MPIIKEIKSYLSIHNNVEQGDTIKFIDAGVFDETANQGKGAWIFQVNVLGPISEMCTKKFQPNKGNRGVIRSAYGDNSDDWKGKEFKVHCVKVRNPQDGKMVDSILLSVPDVMTDQDETISQATR